MSRPSFSLSIFAYCNAWLKEAISTTDESERYALFSQAEQILIDDAPVAVLWYPEIYNIYHSSVKNLSFNELYYYDFSSVYILK